MERDGADPMGISPARVRKAGLPGAAPRQSALATAYPSLVLREKGGKSSQAVTDRRILPEHESEGTEISPPRHGKPKAEAAYERAFSLGVRASTKPANS